MLQIRAGYHAGALFGGVALALAAFAVLLGAGGSQAQAQQKLAADIVFLIDESGSMGPDIAEVKANVGNIASQLGATLEPQFALVGFGSSGGHSVGLGCANSSGSPHIHTNFTDAAGLSSALAGMVTDGGFEPGVEATIFAAQNLSFRPSAGSCFVLISDEDSDGGDIATANSLLAGLQASLFGIVNGNFAPRATTMGRTPAALRSTPAAPYSTF